MDPKNPGVVDEIIHLGDYWDEAAIRKGRQEVLKINSAVGAIFERAYRYLKAAVHIYEDSAVIYAAAADDAKINRVSRELTEEVLGGIPPAAQMGRERCLFASAITPDGLKNYLDGLLPSENLYMLEGSQGTGAERILERLKAAALERGFSVEAYYCAFDPGKLEHLIIPGIDTAFTTVNKYHATDACAFKKIDLNALLDTGEVNACNEQLVFNQVEFDTLLGRAVHTIKGAKALHDEMETYYIPYMDFKSVERCWEATMTRIMAYADEE